jgi:hypothetical protein
MKFFIFLFAIFFSHAIYALDLRSGDILLISFNCYECRVIESETDSKFSHSGVVILDENKIPMVAQALTKVHLAPLNEFLKYKTPGSKISVLRSFELQNSLLDNKMRKEFALKFQNLPFDSKYLWNNFNDKGQELLYCSEFVAKFIDLFLQTPTTIFPLTYKKNYDYWFKYFKGEIPEGELGNSPASFLQDPRFYLVGTIE